MNSNQLKEIYAGLKRQHGPKTLLLFRNGDLLDAYFDDATVISGILGLPLTYPVRQQGTPVPTLTFPCRDQKKYTDPLLDAGHGVCIVQAMDADGNFNTTSL